MILTLRSEYSLMLSLAKSGFYEEAAEHGERAFRISRDIFTLYSNETESVLDKLIKVYRRSDREERIAELELFLKRIEEKKIK